MKLVRLSGSVGDFDRIIMSCIMNREFHPENAMDIMHSEKTPRRTDGTNPYIEILTRMRSFADANGVKLDFPSSVDLDGSSDSVQSYYDNFASTFAALRREREKLTKLGDGDNILLVQLDNLKNIDADIRDFFNLRYAKFRYGRLPRTVFDDFGSLLNENLRFFFFPSSIARDWVYGAYIAPREANGQIDTFFESAKFERLYLPENALEAIPSSKTLRKMDMHNPYSELLRKMQQFAAANSISLDFRAFDALEPDVDAIGQYFAKLAASLDSWEGEIERLRKIAEEDPLILDQVEHMRGINSDIHNFFDLKYAKFRFGRIPRDIYDHYRQVISDDDSYFYFPSSVERDWVYGIYMSPRRADEQTDTFFASLRFERLYIPDKVHGDPREAKGQLQQEIDESRRQASELEQKIKQHLAAENDSFLARYSLLKYLSDSYDMRRYAVSAGNRFVIYGWIPSSTETAYLSLVDQTEGVSYVVDDADSFDAVTPPTKLKNAAPFRPFAPFVEMYGRPSYKEYDPTPLMTVIYTLVYGMMFGDVGQGFLLAGCGFLMWKLKKMWLGRVLIYAGIAGCMFGFAYGSVFGFEDILPFGFHVLESSANTNLALQFSVFIGIGILSLVMLINILNGFRQRDFEKAIFGQSGIAGLILFYTVMLLMLPMLGFLDITVPGALIACGVLVPLVFIVLRHPLGKLCAGDPDWKPESIGGFLVENIFELIEVFLAYVTNAVSFVRIGIFVISHAAMMSIVFMLAGGHETPNLVVVAIGNLFVMGLEGTLVAIQVLRLNFYEMFGRFYSGEGREYNPVIVDYKSATE